ncbi:YebC/PmpR family DNA-binding transcriptional regulator [Candidatus Desantisbacteria bacterium CG_4_10_14_0_8_um_filter_48_22]|uniref:Probable transcriptional regulatory protein COY52_06540 n=1 Tax=Candidatus Desantisbacteria bacterium CG_4_10_14_0_8_um_filter_48_22 TaxID=1974543 RepID=A0A2M7SB36_9BACT|nr:MAG: transcriptional regulator [Candidatus Desantisbacteria bacterium CG1_02_49_89]PIV55769.1 MAG: YebC/PmpR family DNA-binding transcriptional regulator [Candidatus Desantisbacteria bacterium CG02_land_8_20_14_3_00_49_13]PIZ16694.1 MAG: YebC/PmpR family DNA-binding transcriptional regulator [Candidatus Desantisbacteria bacterium CG_4_10_14_0_8_um_filter_48_22]PJB28168.1 MAG: YebC/PmpR family DNA-binding transcriptional regulator [Candidatus Desantisbacteria bacterium CG_4_9_14_3_um_filter_50
MSGHSKWASIKHKKADLDAQRGKAFTKIIKEIVTAARQSGGNPDSNPRLRQAIADARENNMPSENVKKAIQRGTGELPGISYEESVFEGYGPNGVAVMVKVLTDNKNRATSEVRKIFMRNGGNLGEAGCVNWIFSQKGLIYISKKRVTEEDLMTIAIENGAEDVQADDKEMYHIITETKDLEKIKKSFEKIGTDKAEVTMIPSSYVKLEGGKAEQMIRMMNELDEQDDVQEVFANFDIPDEIFEKAMP